MRYFVILSVLFLSGCKVVFVFGVHKDWAIDNSFPRPDLRTNAEVRIERDWDHHR